MGKYLNDFKSEAEYNEFLLKGCARKNVSLVENTNMLSTSSISEGPVDGVVIVDGDNDVYRYVGYTEFEYSPE